MKTYKLDINYRDDFSDMSKKAKQIAKDKGVTVEFFFNNVTCVVNKDTNIKRLFRDYLNSWTMKWKTVGPDCVERYPAEVQVEFEKRSKIEKEKSAKEEAKYRDKEAKEKKRFESKVTGVELEFSDAKGWKKSREANTDSYGGAALDYAEGWAKLMQIEIAKGKTVAQCYEYTQDGLGFLGITGFMFGCAVSILSQTWKHGEELRKVHNKKYGVSEDKKGIATPAILTIGCETKKKT